MPDRSTKLVIPVHLHLQMPIFLARLSQFIKTNAYKILAQLKGNSMVRYDQLIKLDLPCT